MVKTNTVIRELMRNKAKRGEFLNWLDKPDKTEPFCYRARDGRLYYLKTSEVEEYLLQKRIRDFKFFTDDDLKYLLTMTEDVMRRIEYSKELECRKSKKKLYFKISWIYYIIVIAAGLSYLLR